MKTIAAVFAFLLLFAAAAFAQSGRRVVSAPTPTPEPAEPNYSESLPNKTRRSNSVPVFRGSTTPAKTSTQTTAPANDSDEEVVRVETSLISVPVAVYDRAGRYIPNLEKEEFKIFENGVEQEIAYFATTEQPFTVVLLLDTSPSTEYKIEEIQSAAIAFVNQLKPQDKVMVIEFDANVHVLAEPTNDRAVLAKAIKKADFGGGTSLYDAVDFALSKRLNKIEGRKAIVLFTDGVDTTSYKANHDSTIRFAEEAEAIVFPIYYDTFGSNLQRNSGGVMSSPYPQIPGLPGNYPQQPARGTTRREYEFGKKYLEELSEATGGRIFPADSGRGDGLEAAFTGIAEELRKQYSIGYYPSETGQTGQRRQIKVRVGRPNLIVRARDGYIVGASDKPQKTTTSNQFQTLE